MQVDCSQKNVKGLDWCELRFKYVSSLLKGIFRVKQKVVQLFTTTFKNVNYHLSVQFPPVERMKTTPSPAGITEQTESL
jgi:hypothetical protein